MNSRLEGQEWWVLIDQDNRSRMSTREVQAHVQAGRLAPETFVWRDGMSAWASISSIAEFATQNSLRAVPGGQPAAAFNRRLAETVVSSHRAAQQQQVQQQGRRRSVPSPRLALELVVTGAAVLLILLATSYALYAVGAFRSGSSRPGAEAHAGAPAAE